MKLSYYINLILSLENSEQLSERESFAIDGFDTSILILDDVSDQSQIRDGQPCFYITHGIEKAKIEARKLHAEAVQMLDFVCRKRKLGRIKRWWVKLLLHKLYTNIHRGQVIDTELQRTKKVSNNLLKKYNAMITLFTGGHIKYAFAVAFLLGGHNPSYKKEVLLIGEKIGLLRQITDDIKDYQEGHHEPLGDLVNHKKRIPELLFFLNSSGEEKEMLSKLLVEPTKNQKEIKALILNDTTVKILSEKVYSIKYEIDSHLINLPENYKQEIKQLISKFII